MKTKHIFGRLLVRLGNALLKDQSASSSKNYHEVKSSPSKGQFNIMVDYGV